MSSMNLRTLRQDAIRRLRSAGIESAELDVRVLLAHALQWEPARVLAASEEPVGAKARSRFADAVARRAAGEPVARIVGVKEFWSRVFSVSPDVLVPRPETETVVEAALQALPNRDAALRVLDLGVGSGALLAAVLLELPQAHGVGVDRSAGALKIARANFEALGLGLRASLVLGDWSAALGAAFDLVVANPPYVTSGEIAALSREVREHDPVQALDGGVDGLAAYRAIVPELARLLVPGGVAILELGAGQEGEVAALARRAHLLVNEPARCDLSGRPRALVVRAVERKKTLGSGAEPH
jgi:release factor glutamine methyltransferase